jgi:hypothetical protein
MSKVLKIANYAKNNNIKQGTLNRGKFHFLENYQNKTEVKWRRRGVDVAVPKNLK